MISLLYGLMLAIELCWTAEDVDTDCSLLDVPDTCVLTADTGQSRTCTLSATAPGQWVSESARDRSGTSRLRRSRLRCRGRPDHRRVRGDLPASRRPLQSPEEPGTIEWPIRWQSWSDGPWLRRSPGSRRSLSPGRPSHLGIPRLSSAKRDGSDRLGGPLGARRGRALSETGTRGCTPSCVRST